MLVKWPAAYNHTLYSMSLGAQVINEPIQSRGLAAVILFSHNAVKELPQHLGDGPF